MKYKPKYKLGDTIGYKSCYFLKPLAIGKIVSYAKNQHGVFGYYIKIINQTDHYLHCIHKSNILRKLSKEELMVLLI